MAVPQVPVAGLPVLLTVQDLLCLASTLHHCAVRSDTWSWQRHPRLDHLICKRNIHQHILVDDDVLLSVIACAGGACRARGHPQHLQPAGTTRTPARGGM